jgi:hypothetical protein
MKIKHTIIKNIMLMLIMSNNAQATADTTITYPTYKDSPGYNTPEVDHKFDNVKPILFTPNEDTVTGDDSNENQKGYFWTVTDPDKTITFPGKARIGNSQYINVVAIDSKKLNTVGDSNYTSSTDEEDLFNQSPEIKKLFDDNYLVPIGTFMKPNETTVYTLLGQYISTVFPDPRVVAVTGPSAVAIVSQ